MSDMNATLSSMLPDRLYSCEQTRLLDRYASEIDGLPGIVLMERAANVALACALDMWPDLQELVIFCGAGNNAGDGYLMAALAKQKKLSVRIFAFKDPAKLVGDAGEAYHKALLAGVSITLGLSDQNQALLVNLPASTIFVDALLGTGLKGPVRADYETAIHFLNRQPQPVLAIDIPSGLCGDTGSILGAAVNAQTTITFIGVKQGLLTAYGTETVGRLVFDDLGVSDKTYASLTPDIYRVDLQRCRIFLPKRKNNSHKGSHGRLLLVGGDKGYGGAIIMAAEAAARCGVGLISVATQACHIAPILTRMPELMARGVSSINDLEPLLSNASVVALGPGMGLSAWSEQVFFDVIKRGLPMVIDADALNLLSHSPELIHEYRQTLSHTHKNDNYILTPHPGEASRLLGVTTHAIQTNRFTAAKQIQEKFGGVVILKGAGTVIASPEGIYLANVGNPGMASGGMGDILTGIVASLMAQGLKAEQAALLGVTLHGQAGDNVAEHCGMHGMLATDLIAELRAVLNQPIINEL